MTRFRDLLAKLDASGELFRVRKTVAARHELGALLKQAEARRKGILFHSVDGGDFPVVANLLTTSQRMALGLGRDDAATFTRKQHADLVRAAIASPLAPVQVATALCKEVLNTGDQVNCAELPVPTFFAEDSGPFLTAAAGISRNPDNGVLNVGIYRILMLDDSHVAVSASPSSDLFRFLAKAAERGETMSVALVIGADPAVLMAAAAKVPADISELDVAGALNGAALELAEAETSDLLIPGDAELVIEVEVDPSQTMMNRMGEFGDFYGDQNAPIASVTAITHRKDAIFHAVMAGAGAEHNSIGLIILADIEPMLEQLLAESYPAVDNIRVYFEPPRMGVLGDVYVQLAQDAAVDVRQLIRDVFGMRCGIFDIARVIRRVIVVDHDIDISLRRDIDWAISVRANTVDQVILFDDLAATDNKLRIGINATANATERERFRRLEIPGGDSVRLEDYLE